MTRQAAPVTSVRFIYSEAGADEALLESAGVGVLIRPLVGDTVFIQGLPYRATRVAYWPEPGIAGEVQVDITVERLTDTIEDEDTVEDEGAIDWIQE